MNPRLFLCVVIAWLITNGWSYIFFAIGTYFGNSWMIGISSAYLAILWIPFSPEKVITFVIAMGLLRLLFPNDQKTLAVLRELHNKARNTIKNRKDKKKDL